MMVKSQKSVSLMTRPRRKFTKRQLETAVEVLKECRTVQRWVRAQANFLGIDLTTPDGERYLDRQTTIAAWRIVRR